MPYSAYIFLLIFHIFYVLALRNIHYLLSMFIYEYVIYHFDALVFASFPHDLDFLCKNQDIYG